MAKIVWPCASNSCYPAVLESLSNFCNGENMGAFSRLKYEMLASNLERRRIGETIYCLFVGYTNPWIIRGKVRRFRQVSRWRNELEWRRFTGVFVPSIHTNWQVPWSLHTQTRQPGPLLHTNTNSYTTFHPLTWSLRTYFWSKKCFVKFRFNIIFVCWNRVLESEYISMLVSWYLECGNGCVVMCCVVLCGVVLCCVLDYQPSRVPH